MASLSGRQIKNTFKDILHVFDGDLNEGLESGVKRVWDGEGIGSPLWLGDSSVELQGIVKMGTSNSTGNYDFFIYGDKDASSSPAKLPYIHFDADDRKFTLNDVELVVTETINAGNGINFSNASYNSGASTAGITFNASGQLVITQGLVTQGEVKFEDGSGNEVGFDVSDGTIKKGTDEGQIKLGANDVTIKTGSEDLLIAKDDGTITIKNVSALGAFPTAVLGAVISKGGDFYVGVN